MHEIDIKKLCNLSLLQLEEGEEQKLGAQLADIVALVEHLPQRVPDSDMLAEMPTMTLRPDVVTPSLTREELLAVAPATEAGCILVPDVHTQGGE